MPKSRLFDEEDDGGSDLTNKEKDTLKINKEYAENYSKWRGAEELQYLKDKYGDDLSDSESESSDNDYVDPENPEFDRDFLKTIAVIRSKDPSLIEKGSFFKDSYKTNNPKEKEEKPMTLGDFQRRALLEGDENMDDEDDFDAPKEKMDYLIRNPSPIKPQKKMVGFADDNVEVSEDEEGGFITKPSCSKDTNSTKDNDVLLYMKGSLSSLNAKDDEKLLFGLRDAWKDEKLTKNESWLKDFFLNKRYLEDDDEGIQRPPNAFVLDEETISEDEETLNKLEEFETKYRFRYEEPDEEFIKKYSRILPDSLRVDSNKRKLSRESKKQREAEDLERRRQEIMQLKALQRKEVQDKLEKLQKVAGNDIGIQETDLDNDFDPEKYDATMAKLFNDQYYGEEKELTKPIFDPDDDGDIYEDYDDWLTKNSTREQDGKSQDFNDYYHYEQDEQEENEEICDINHPDFNMDADYDGSKKSLKQEMIEASSKKKRARRHQNKLAEVLEKKKPSYDPNMGTFDEYYDRYYQLDYEDLVAGNPVRFKYTRVDANNFGLSTEEILSARDKELNKWYPLKKMFMHNRTSAQEAREITNFNHRASHVKVKQKILPSLFAEDHAELLEADQEKKKKKYLKKKLRKQRKKLQEGGSLNTSTPNEDKASASTSEPNSARSRKRKRRDSQEDKPDPIDSPEQTKCSKELEEKDITDIASKIAKPHNNSKKHKTKPNKKLKRSESSNNYQQKKKFKKETGQHIKSHEDKVHEMFNGISDSRLAAYGENPKKLKNKFKYGNKT